MKIIEEIRLVCFLGSDGSDVGVVIFQDLRLEIKGNERKNILLYQSYQNIFKTFFWVVLPVHVMWVQLVAINTFVINWKISECSIILVGMSVVRCWVCLV